MKKNIEELLSNNTYPGRGILIGCSEDGKRSIIVYFIMGRSENSRNRVFERTDDGIRTRAFDESKMTDPSLVIYHPVRSCGEKLIVTNGVQTDTVFECLQGGQGFRDAMYKWQFEPDPPIYTPRISGLVAKDGSYSLSILKTANGDPECCCRYFYEYSGPLPGLGHFISTYKMDGNPPPSFEGEPIPVGIADSGGLEAFSIGIWNALDAENKVSLYARECDLSSGEVSDFIINKHG